MAVKISAYRALLWELSSLVEERHPINMYNPFRSDFSPLSDSEYKSIKGSVDKLKSFSKGAVYGKTDSVKTSNIDLNNVYSIQDVLTANKKQIIAVVNFKPKQIADFLSEGLVLGVETENGVVLLSPDQEVPLGKSIS